MQSKHVDLLLEQIDAENEMDALLRLVPRIVIDVPILKSIMRRHICTLDETAARKQLFTIKAIDAIFPKDILQHIAFFCHSASQRSINKSFQKCYDRNQDLIRKRRPQIVEITRHLFAPKVNHNESTNQIFIVHPEGQQLSEDAQKYGKRVCLMTDLTECIGNAESGDKILIDDGSYSLHAEGLSGLRIGGKHLQIIGIGDNVRIDVRSTNLFGVPGVSQLIINGGSKIFLKKLHIQFPHRNPLKRRGIIVEDSSLWVDQCELCATERVIAHSNSSIQILDSIISAQRGIQALCDEGGALETIVIGCSFNIKGKLGEAIIANGTLQCFGNVFKRGTIVFDLQSGNRFVGNLFEDCSFPGAIEVANKICFV